MALAIHWNVLEWPMECVGMCWNVLEFVGMAHGMGWNGLEWPLESGGMNLEFVGMEFHLDSIGIRQNGRFQPFRWIPDGIPWNSNIPVGVCRIPPELMGEGKVLQSVETAHPYMETCFNYEYSVKTMGREDHNAGFFQVQYKEVIRIFYE